MSDSSLEEEERRGGGCRVTRSDRGGESARSGPKIRSVRQVQIQ